MLPQHHRSFHVGTMARISYNEEKDILDDDDRDQEHVLVVVIVQPKQHQHDNLYQGGHSDQHSTAGGTSE